MSKSPPIYQTRIVPALHRIQATHGYLKREALQELKKESGTPLYQLQAVASFFPHFRMQPPPKMTLQICRDMACHLAGSGKIIEELTGLSEEGVRVEGVSCIGRCDRAPAACVMVRPSSDSTSHAGGSHGGEEEHYYVERSARQLDEIVRGHLRGNEGGGSGDDSEKEPATIACWLVDPYKGAPPDLFRRRQSGRSAPRFASRGRDGAARAARLDSGARRFISPRCRAKADRQLSARQGYS